MSKINELTNSLSRTWETVSQGWNHLMSNASNALTRFVASEDKQNADNVPASSPQWGLMSADMYDDATKVVVKLEAPGLVNDDFDINITDNILTISGEKRFQQEKTKGNYRILECAYGRFSRSIPLGYEVDAETAKASYDRGVLKIELDKKPHQRRRKIEIK
jgi:HSP20 family protein